MTGSLKGENHATRRLEHPWTSDRNMQLRLGLPHVSSMVCQPTEIAVLPWQCGSTRDTLAVFLWTA
jgi:hypothetical protein